MWQNAQRKLRIPNRICIVDLDRDIKEELNEREDLFVLVVAGLEAGDDGLDKTVLGVDAAARRHFGQPTRNLLVQRQVVAHVHHVHIVLTPLNTTNQRSKFWGIVPDFGQEWPQRQSFANQIGGFSIHFF